MDAAELRRLQKPLKERYKEHPEAARIVLRAEGSLGPNVTCRVSGPAGPVVAGLHAATGGDGTAACAVEILLQAVVACAGVTLNAVATAMGVPIREGKLRAEGDLDVRGTLGVARDVPVGLQRIRLYYELDTDAEAAQIAKLLELTERYCVVLQTLAHPPKVEASYRIAGGQWTPVGDKGEAARPR